MIEWLAKKIGWLLGQTSAQLDDFLSWYLIIPIYALVFLIIFELLSVFVRKELKKRKEIISEVQAFKSNYEVTLNDETKVANEENVMKTFLQYKQKTYPEEYYLQINEIIQKRKPKPFFLILIIAIQSMLSFVFFAHLLLQDSMQESFYLEIVAILLSGLLMYGRRLLWIKVPLFLLASYTYLNVFTTEALIFVILVSGFRLVKNILQQIKKKNTMP